MDLHVYTFEDASGTEATYTTQDPNAARYYAQAAHALVIDNVYEWSEAVPIFGWDYRDQEEEE